MAFGPYLAYHLFLSIKVFGFFFFNTTIPIRLYIFKDFFYASMAVLSSSSRDPMASKDENIH